MDIAATPAPLNRPTAVLTPKGDAVCLLYRLINALGVLPDDDRAAVIELLAVELEPDTLPF
jgi:hypothetical protein